VMRNNDPKAHYVKGCLMPTRAFGDLRLKHKEFNFHSFSPELGYRRPIPQYSANYISHKPEIKVHQITDKDEWLILASDGLWDELKRKEAAEIVAKKGSKTQKEICYALFNEALEHVSKKEGLSRDFIA